MTRRAVREFVRHLGNGVNTNEPTIAYSREGFSAGVDRKNEDMLSVVCKKLRHHRGGEWGTASNKHTHTHHTKAKERRSRGTDTDRKYGPEFSSDAEGDGPEEEGDQQRRGRLSDDHSREEKLLGFHAGIFRKGKWLLPRNELAEWRGGLPGWKVQEYKRLDKGRLAQKATLANVRKAGRKSKSWREIDLPVTPVWREEVEEEERDEAQRNRGSRALVVLKDWMEEQSKLWREEQEAREKEWKGTDEEVTGALRRRYDAWGDLETFVASWNEYKGRNQRRALNWRQHERRVWRTVQAADEEVCEARERAKTAGEGVGEAVRRKDEWNEADAAVGEALEGRPGPRWENHGSKFSSDDEGDGPENTTTIAIRICLGHLGSEARRKRKEASKQEDATYELRRWCYIQLNGTGWTMQQWAEAGRSTAGRERGLELAGSIFCDQNQLMDWTREWDRKWEKMSNAWRNFQRASRTIQGLKSERVLWVLVAGAKGERINRDEWGRVQRNKLGWRGGRNLEEDTQRMWENRGRANITWAEEVAPAIEQGRRRSKEGWCVWMRWAVAEKAEAERSGQRAVAKKVIAMIVWRVARIPRSNETKKWTREAGHRIRFIQRVLREVGAVSSMTRVGHEVAEAARREVPGRWIQQGVGGDGIASGEGIALVPRGGNATTREEREEKEKERKKEAAIGVVIDWMKEDGADRTGRRTDRARKLTVLDHGLIGVGKYIAHLRRKKEGAKK